jgi:hypothetical protein
MKLRIGLFFAVVLVGCGGPSFGEQLQAEAEFRVATPTSLMLGEYKVASGGLYFGNLRLSECAEPHSLHSLQSGAVVAVCAGSVNPPLKVIYPRTGRPLESLNACDLGLSGVNKSNWPWNSLDDLRSSGIFSKLGSCH